MSHLPGPPHDNGGASGDPYETVDQATPARSDPDPQDSNTPKSASVEACEAILDRFLAALNAQDFSLDTWNRIAPNLRVAWGVLDWSKDRDKDLPLHEWLQAMQVFAQRAPHYRFEVWNVTTVVDEQMGTAESLMNVKSVGVYPGIVRTAVSGFSFVRTEGKWEAVRHGAFPGSGLI